MTLTLGDAFARRKKLNAELETWISRLSLASKDTVQYKTKAIEGEEKFVPIPGSKKVYTKTYTIKECREKIGKLIKEDQEFALRISLTNQVAKAKLIDLDGKEKELTIPELLVLRNEIGPKREQAARAIPKQPKGVEPLEEKDEFLKWRSIQPIYKEQQEMGEKGFVITNEYVDHYIINEVTDYGLPEREVYDLIDTIHAWMHRIKEAINEANKTPLVELK